LSDFTRAHPRERGNLLAVGERAAPGRIVDLLHRRADLVPPNAHSSDTDLTGVPAAARCLMKAGHQQHHILPVTSRRPGEHQGYGGG
jgi:hypothetical protein